MKQYELAVIINSQIEDTKRSESINEIKDLISKVGGSVNHVDEFGKKTFSYEIKKMKEGYYYFIYFESDAKVLIDIEYRLRIMNNVIRFFIISKQKHSSNFKKLKS